MQGELTTLCQEVADCESVEFLFSCGTIFHFWKRFLSRLRDDVQVGTTNESDLICRKLDVVSEFILINHILLLGKYYTDCRGCLNNLRTLRDFIARILRRPYTVYCNIELHIAREENNLSSLRS